MFIVQKNLEKIRKQLTIDQVSYVVILILFILFIFKACQLYSKPVTNQQYQHVTELALQAQYPQTQQLAQQLVTEPDLNTVRYFKLIYALHYEASKIRHQPSIQLDNNAQVID